MIRVKRCPCIHLHGCRAATPACCCCCCCTAAVSVSSGAGVTSCWWPRPPHFQRSGQQPCTCISIACRAIHPSQAPSVEQQHREQAGHVGAGVGGQSGAVAHVQLGCTGPWRRPVTCCAGAGQQVGGQHLHPSVPCPAQAAQEVRSTAASSQAAPTCALPLGRGLLAACCCCCWSRVDIDGAQVGQARPWRGVGCHRALTRHQQQLLQRQHLAGRGDNRHSRWGRCHRVRGGTSGVACCSLSVHIIWLPLPASRWHAACPTQEQPPCLLPVSPVPPPVLHVTCSCYHHRLGYIHDRLPMAAATVSIPTSCPAQPQHPRSPPTPTPTHQLMQAGVLPPRLQQQLRQPLQRPGRAGHLQQQQPEAAHHHLGGLAPRQRRQRPTGQLCVCVGGTRVCGAGAVGWVGR